MKVPLVIGAIATTLAYYAGVQLGFELRFPQTTTSVLWPPNAILTVALLLTPVSRWWIYLAAAFPAHLIAELPVLHSASLVFWLFVTNCAEALIAATTVRWLNGGSARFDSLRHVAGFLAGAVLLAPMLSSFLDAAVVAMFRGENYWGVWITRFCSNALTQLTLVPAAVTWLSLTTADLERTRWPRWLEAAALVTALSLTTVGAIVFASESIAEALTTPLIFVLPFLVWAAVRFGVPGASAATLISSAIVIWMGTRGQRIVWPNSPVDEALGTQLFLIVQSIPVMCLAAVVEDNRRVEDSLKDGASFERFLAALSHEFGEAPTHDLSARFGAWLHALGTHFKLSTAALFRSDEDGRLVIEHVWPSSAAFRLEPSDYERLSLACAGGEAALQLNGFLAIPLRAAERVVGCLAVSRGREIARVSQDVSQLHRVSGELAHLLARAHADHERELARREVQRSREQLLHLGRLSTTAELAASLAHELNQPLTGILGNAQVARSMIERGNPDLDELHQILTDIVEDERRAAATIQRVWKLVRKEPTEMLPLDINALVLEVARLLASDAMTRRQSFAFDLCESEVLVTGDTAQLSQVLINLLINAMDAMQRASKEAVPIVIRTSIREDGAVQVSVEDSGHGMSTEVAPLIFEPFYTTKPNGMGMGLTISQAIVTAHGGTLWAANRPDAGAVFHFTLPPVNAHTALGLASKTRLA